jgi:hypothetical protein
MYSLTAIQPQSCRAVQGGMDLFRRTVLPNRHVEANGEHIGNARKTLPLGRAVLLWGFSWPVVVMVFIIAGHAMATLGVVSG